MKLRFFLGTIIFLSSLIGQGQSRNLHSDKSPLFGQDIVIDKNPFQNQKLVAICSDSNSLYSAHTYINQTNNCPAFTVLRSNDNGMSWVKIIDDFIARPGAEISSIDINVLGRPIPKVFFACSFDFDSSTTGESVIFKYDESTGNFESLLLHERNSYSLAFATDKLSPSPGTSPCSIGIILSKWKISPNGLDSVIYLLSTNGGISFDYRHVIDTTSKYFHKVDICYGKSASCANGKYFAVWELSDEINTYGKIFTARNAEGINSLFTSPFRLDKINPIDSNTFQNPSMASQYTNFDNDSTNLSQVILVEKRNFSTNKNSIICFQNSKAASYSNFTRINMTEESQNCIQPFTIFNPYDFSFYTSYFDSTRNKLPLFNQDINFINAEISVSENYADTIVIHPNPIIGLNDMLQKTVNLWSGIGNDGNSVAFFDSEYSVFNTVFEDNVVKFIVYPNPVTNDLFVKFSNLNNSLFHYFIYNLKGQLLKNDFSRTNTETHNIDFSSLPLGEYLLVIKINQTKYSTKIIHQ